MTPGLCPFLIDSAAGGMTSAKMPFLPQNDRYFREGWQFGKKWQAALRQWRRRRALAIDSQERRGLQPRGLTSLPLRQIGSCNWHLREGWIAICLCIRRRDRIWLLAIGISSTAIFYVDGALALNTPFHRVACCRLLVLCHFQWFFSKCHRTNQRKEFCLWDVHISTNIFSQLGPILAFS